MEKIKSSHLKIRFHFLKQTNLFSRKLVIIVPPSLFPLSGEASPASALPMGRDMLGHLAKDADGFLLLGYWRELFKDLESVCWVKTRLEYG